MDDINALIEEFESIAEFSINCQVQKQNDSPFDDSLNEVESFLKESQQRKNLLETESSISEEAIKGGATSVSDTDSNEDNGKGNLNIIHIGEEKDEGIINSLQIMQQDIKDLINMEVLDPPLGGQRLRRIQFPSSSTTRRRVSFCSVMETPKAEASPIVKAIQLKFDETALETELAYLMSEAEMLPRSSSASYQIPATPPSTPQIPVTPPSTPQIPVTPPSIPQIPVTPPSTPQIPVTPPTTPQIPVTPPTTPQIPVTPPTTPQIPVTPPTTPQIPAAPPNTPQIPATPLSTPASETVTHPLSPTELCNNRGIRSLPIKASPPPKPPRIFSPSLKETESSKWRSREGLIKTPTGRAPPKPPRVLRNTSLEMPIHQMATHYKSLDNMTGVQTPPKNENNSQTPLKVLDLEAGKLNNIKTMNDSTGKIENFFSLFRKKYKRSQSFSNNNSPDFKQLTGKMQVQNGVDMGADSSMTFQSETEAPEPIIPSTPDTEITSTPDESTQHNQLQTDPIDVNTIPSEENDFLNSNKILHTNETSPTQNTPHK